jgi:hypothetical protein
MRFSNGRVFIAFYGAAGAIGWERSAAARLIAQPKPPPARNKE